MFVRGPALTHSYTHRFALFCSLSTRGFILNYFLLQISLSLYPSLPPSPPLTHHIPPQHLSILTFNPV